MRRAIIVFFLSGVCAACSSGTSGSNLLPHTPGGGGGPPPVTSATPSPTPAATATPTFKPSSVHLTEYAVAATPQYVGAQPDGSVYFGFGANGGGSDLYRYAGGSFTQTSPAAPPDGFGPGGGVYSITATPSQVYWLSAYSGSGLAPYVTVECGGNGNATLCGPTVDQPTSVIVDGSGVLWVGGWSFNGNGLITTSTQATGQFNGGVVQLVLGPGGNVWAVLQDPTSYEIAELTVANGSMSVLQDFVLPSGEAAGSVTYGGDGALWFTDHQRGAIGRMDGSGNFTEYPLPSSNGLGLPWYGLWQIATACDGTVWFTEPSANAIGRIDTKGSIHEFPVLSANAYPDAIAATGATPCSKPELWVGEQYSSKLASVAF